MFDIREDENYDPAFRFNTFKKSANSSQQHIRNNRSALGDVTSQVANRQQRNTTDGKRNNYHNLKNGNPHYSKFASKYINQYYENKEPAAINDNNIRTTNKVNIQSTTKLDNNNVNTTKQQNSEIDRTDDNKSDDIIPLLPIYNEEITRALQIAYSAYYNDLPDNTDADTYDIAMVTENSNDIFTYMRDLELNLRPNPHYMDVQPHLKWSYRATLIDWIVEVHLKFQLLPETLFLTINLIDRFLSKKLVTLNKFQLVGASALFIAAKYEEINCPTLKDMIYILDNLYTREELLEAEKFMIDSLEFEIGWPGPMSFLRRISKADEYEYNTRTLAKYLLETTIMDPKLCSSPTSWLASGAYYLSKIILGDNDWSLKHVYYSGYTQDQLIPLVSLIIDNCRIPNINHPAIWEKYSSRRYHRSSQTVIKWIKAADEKVNS
ncbi:B-type cyclin CLB4 NDAI_0D00650 [Naumovozyma dairenensis CBS 421]|uniref:Uncharacterized protein n=1 Tax=Naumovozyma dairenensis (strain ATCC 10597 / BCRC 20456 / CBS 421 / NBRC 0211 / NRRL Y-12639) TaxID=1071378 RepID=G0W9B8_NAUDC|nr:hypothetical protein NDAI_0D00650 [Naumovozyma dairenensis CBS 421]CCD24379.1 hypothetical protein NDAI_0D00650 [Naumovozyma dairenensis CBS 421]